MKLSDKTIDVLTDLVVGGNITVYKSGPELVSFFNSVGFKDTYGQGFPSRVTYAKNKIRSINDTPLLPELIVSIFNPINYIEMEESLIEATDKLNRYLDFDGYEVQIQKKKAVIISRERFEVGVEANDFLTDEFTHEQLQKCDQRIAEHDYDGAITNSRSLVEGVINSIHLKISGDEIKKSGDLKKDFKNIRDLLNLSSDQYTDENLKQILNGLSSIIDGIDRISNDMGDRHRRKIKPSKHHAKLAVNSAKTVIDFLVDTYQYQESKGKISALRT